jgi:ERCC4-related helicase
LETEYFKEPKNSERVTEICEKLALANTTLEEVEIDIRSNESKKKRLLETQLQLLLEISDLRDELLTLLPERLEDA